MSPDANRLSSLHISSMISRDLGSSSENNPPACASLLLNYRKTIANSMHTKKIPIAMGGNLSLNIVLITD